MIESTIDLFRCFACSEIIYFSSCSRMTSKSSWTLPQVVGFQWVGDPRVLILPADCSPIWSTVPQYQFSSGIFLNLRLECQKLNFIGRNESRTPLQNISNRKDLGRKCHEIMDFVSLQFSSWESTRFSPKHPSCSSASYGLHGHDHREIQERTGSSRGQLFERPIHPLGGLLVRRRNVAECSLQFGT